MNSNPVSLEKNFIDSSRKNTWLHKWEPRTKVISCIIMILGLTSLKTPGLLMVSYLILMMLLLGMGMSPGTILKRTSYTLPFIIFMGLPILLGGGLPPSKDRVTLVLLLIFKALNALYIMFIMFFSQPATDLLNSLAYMKLPNIFISIIFLAWRYLFLLGEKFSKTYKALLSRLFQPRIKKASLKIYGQIMGGMVIKSLDSSDKVYRAMISRGFNGRIPISKPKKVQLSDLIKTMLMIGTVALLNILEKWWF